MQLPVTAHAMNNSLPEEILGDGFHQIGNVAQKFHNLKKPESKCPLHFYLKIRKMLFSVCLYLQLLAL